MPTRADICVVLVHDGHERSHQLASRLVDQTCCSIVRTSDDHDDFLDGILHLRPDVLVTDLQARRNASTSLSSDTDWIQAFRRNAPDTSILMVLDSFDPVYIAQIVRAGANGIVDRPTLTGELMSILTRLDHGTSLMSRRAAEALTVAWPNPGDFLLSEREGEVLGCLADGSTNAQIATQLYVSRETVKTHVANLLRKLEVPDRRAAVERARHLGLLDNEAPETDLGTSSPGLSCSQCGPISAGEDAGPESRSTDRHPGIGRRTQTRPNHPADAFSPENLLGQLEIPINTIIPAAQLSGTEQQHTGGLTCEY